MNLRFKNTLSEFRNPADIASHVRMIYEQFPNEIIAYQKQILAY
jgi:hypothetical protein